jgi:hypothetical protein
MSTPELPLEGAFFVEVGAFLYNVFLPIPFDHSVFH